MPMVTGWNDGAVAFAGHPHAELALYVDDGAGRDDQRVLMALDREAHARVHAGLQPEVRDSESRSPPARCVSPDRESARRRATRPAKFSPGYASTSVSPAVPCVMRRRSFSTTLITSRTVRISTTEMNDVFTPTLAPGSSVRLPTKPSTGDVMTVLARLILSSSRRALRLSHLRLREVELRDRRLISRVGIVEGLAWQQIALEQAARAFEVVLRQLQVRLPLADRRLRDVIGRFGLIDLFDDLAVFDLRDRLSAPHRIAELHIDRVQPALPARHCVDRCGADEIADDRDGVDHVPPRHRRELDGHRRAWAAAATATAAAKSATAETAAAPAALTLLRWLSARALCAAAAAARSSVK